MRRFAFLVAAFLALASLLAPEVARPQLGSSSTQALDFDFQNGRYWQGGPTISGTVGSFVTVSRASVKYCDDLTGAWQQAAINTLCVTSGINGKGALIEEPRTNLIRNNSMQGAVAGTPGTLPTNWAVSSADGLTTNVIGTGTSLGIDYIDIQITGTPSGSSYALVTEGQNVVACANGQTWSNANFIALVGGSTSNISSITIRIRTFASDGVTTEEASAGTDYKGLLVASLQRLSQTATWANAATAFCTNQLVIGTTASQAINVTLRIGWPDLELGAFATSPIRTTNAAVSRAADYVTASTTPANLCNPACTLFGKGTIPSNTGNFSILLAADDGTTSNRAEIFRLTDNTTAKAITTNAGVNGGQTTNSGFVSGSSHKLAYAVQSGSQAASLDGAATSTTANSWPPAATLNKVEIGNVAQNLFFNGYVERIGINNARLPNDKLQQWTTAANDNEPAIATMLAQGYGPGDVPKRVVWGSR